MKAHWTDLAIATLLLGAGCAAIYAGLARIMRRSVAGRQRETEQQLYALATTVKELQARVAQLGESQAARAEAGDVAAISGSAENMARAESAQIKPQTLAAITAAAVTFLDKMPRVRSAESLPAAQNSAGAWAQQGRVIVQTSHNLRPRS